LPRSVRAIAPTQRGHGDAGKPAAGYRPQDFAHDLARLMDALGLEAAVVVGHSMGSYVAQRFALDFPGRARGLVLAGTFPGLRGNPGAAELRQAVAALTDPVDPAFARGFQESTLARPVPPALLETVTQESLKVPARVWRAALEALIEDDHAAELGRIAVPALVVWGDQDAFFPRADQDAVVTAIPGARLLVYEGCGHGLHWEEPERFARDVAGFAEKAWSERNAG
jgi:pimeloyl-ACP methyl ester carboxylesterase